MYETIREIKGQELVYDLPFSAENVQNPLDKLDQRSKTPVEFIFKDEEIEYRNLWEDPEYQKKYSLSTKNNNDENEDITF
ncbi:MAG: hypothetical protein ACXWFZ_06425 [Nitrososphaeraceae archaeon]